MNTKQIFKGKLGKMTPLALFLLMGNTLLADTANAKLPGTGFPYVEVFGSGAIIILIIVIAWMMGAKQSKPEPHHGPTDYHGHARKQFNHPHDPHFKKLKRKTS